MEFVWLLLQNVGTALPTAAAAAKVCCCSSCVCVCVCFWLFSFQLGVVVKQQWLWITKVHRSEDVSDKAHVFKGAGSSLQRHLEIWEMLVFGELELLVQAVTNRRSRPEVWHLILKMFLFSFFWRWSQSGSNHISVPPVSLSFPWTALPFSCSSHSPSVWFSFFVLSRMPEDFSLPQPCPVSVSIGRGGLRKRKINQMC